MTGFWCKGCSGDGEGDTVACVGCAFPPCVGSVVRVGGWVACHKGATVMSGAELFGGFKGARKVLSIVGGVNRPGTTRVIVEGRMGNAFADTTACNIADLYPCEEPERKSEPEVADRATVTA